MGISMKEILRRKEEAEQVTDNLRKMQSVISTDSNISGALTRAVRKAPGCVCASDQSAMDVLNTAIIRLTDYVSILEAQMCTAEVEWPPAGKQVT